MHPAPGGVFKHPSPETGVPPTERERMLREAHVIVCSLPYPKELRERTPNLKWVQFLFAGVSDFKHCDLWGTDIALTSARGYVEALPIAEALIAAALMFAKDLPLAVRQTDGGTLDRASYGMQLIHGKTFGVVGLGGIGAHAARLAKGLGMRTVATKYLATTRQENAEGVDVLYPPSQLLDMLPECDFVAACAPLTDATRGMFDKRAIAAMKPGATFLNVARGELADEGALKDALRSGHLRGAYLDVYTGEAVGPPDPELLALPNVVMTPHTSGITDEEHDFAMQLFRDNLAHFVAGDTLKNLVEWDSGY